MPDFDFGDDGAYIVAAFGITALVFAVMIAGSLSHARRWKRRFEEQSRK